MPRYTFASLLTDVEAISNVKDNRALIRNAVQTALDRVASAWDWPWLEQEDFITTVAPYEAGTVSITSGAKAVSGVSTIFTVGMVGRFIRFGTEIAYYRIASFTSTTAITLEEPYQATSDLSGGTYSIYKDEYRLPADLDSYKMFRQMQNGQSILDIDSSLFDILYPTPTAEGEPSLSSLFGTRLDTYTTGTVTMSAGGTVITGSSTVWDTIQGLGRGVRILIGSQVFTVKSVDSATQITTYETALVAASASAYTVYLRNPIIKLHTIPSAARNIKFRYQRIPFPLRADTDIPDMPDEWQWILVQGALIWAYGQQSNMQMIQNQEALFRSYITDMIRKVGYVSGNKVRRKAPDDPSMSSRPRRPLYPAQYDVRYST